MYFPKNKIETNLYSNGDFIVISTDKIYYGYYFSTHNGGFYTGKEPNDGSNKALQPISGDGALGESPTYPGVIDYRFTRSNRNYSILTNQPKNYNPITPIPYNPNPKAKDYQTGEFTRHFAKKRNENIYYEVEDQRLSLNPIYLTFSIQWVISGKEEIVSTINKNTVELYMRNLPIPAFDKFLKNDYLKFWKPS